MSYAFLGGHGHEAHDSVQLVHHAAANQADRRAVERAQLHVVAAGVRRAGCFVGEGVIGQYNRVQFPHQCDCGCVRAPAKISRYAGDALFGPALQAQTRERGAHFFSRFELGKRRFRLAQNAVAERDESHSVFVDCLADSLFQRHEIVHIVCPLRRAACLFSEYIIAKRASARKNFARKSAAQHEV